MTLSQDSYKPLDELIKSIIKQKQPYQRLVIKKADLLKMFEYNRFKHRLIETRLVYSVESAISIPDTDMHCVPEREWTRPLCTVAVT